MNEGVLVGGLLVGFGIICLAVITFSIYFWWRTRKGDIYEELTTNPLMRPFLLGDPSEETRYSDDKHEDVSHP